MNTELFTEPMKMEVIHVTGWSLPGVTSYQTSVFGSTAFPTAAAQPPEYPNLVSPYNDRTVWTEERGYEMTELKVILEWDFEYQ
jgi:hypothetical protein